MRAAPLMSSRRGSEIAKDEIAAGGMTTGGCFFTMTMFSRTLAVLRRRSGLRVMMPPAFFSVYCETATFLHFAIRPRASRLGVQHEKSAL
jgi:hypothetical protein